MALLPLAVALLDGCGSSTPQRPYGNLGDSVNSRFDEFAPAIRPGRSGLYFTSNRVSSEDIWRAGSADPAGPSPFFTKALIDSSDISLLSRPSTNDGSVVFTTANTGFFASGHAPDTVQARDEGTYGGIVGGTDLFEFRFGGRGIEVANLSAAINSRFWDSHPAAAIRGDSLLLIFSSDRPSNGTGYSSPYNGTIALGSGGDSIRGNADLYYVFRINGRWGAVKNFTMVEGSRDVNSPAHEYSPFLYCIDERPRLLFSSDRNGSFDIWSADLEVDFARGTLGVAELGELPRGTDSINTSDNELFPFMTAPSASGGYIYLASDRDSTTRTVAGKEIASVGGYDLYRFPFSLECRPPQLRYEVVLIDAENPSRPVPAPVFHLHRTSGGAGATEPSTRPEMEGSTNPAVFLIDFNSDYAMYGGSAYNEVRCDENDRAIESYASVRIRQLEPEIRKRVTQVWRDTIEGGRWVTFIDSTLERDTIPLAELSSIASTSTSLIKAISTSGDRVVVTRVNLSERREMVGGVPRKYKAQLVEYDTIARIDTILVPTTQALAPSERVKRLGSIGVPKVRTEMTIRDTIWVRPNYYQPPQCEWVYTRSVIDEYRKNVPYFQTAFWEVNTTENLRRDLKRLSSQELNDAGFVELHPDNLYFGASTGRRPERINDYTEFARLVDKNLAGMAEELAEVIIPEFMAYDAKTPGSNNKLVIQVAAYSDFRPIVRGYYAGSETVEYVAGIYDPTSGGLNLRDVRIQPGASLVSENNDTLSKLRVFFGYRELLERLEKYPGFQKLVADGTILLPASGLRADAFHGKVEKAKIIVVMEGRYADRSEQPTTSGYTGKGNDFYRLDDVRRMDLQVNRLEYINGRLVKSPCCSDKPQVPKER